MSASDTRGTLIASSPIGANTGRPSSVVEVEMETSELRGEHSGGETSANRSGGLRDAVAGRDFSRGPTERTSDYSSLPSSRFEHGGDPMNRSVSESGCSRVAQSLTGSLSARLESGKRKILQSSTDSKGSDLDITYGGNSTNNISTHYEEDTDLPKKDRLKFFVRPSSGSRAESGASWKMSKGKKKKKSADLPELSFDDIPNMELEEFTSADIGNAAIEWLDQIDQLRAKSSNIQGKFLDK